MKINKISSKLIKPYTPTPQNLKKYNISFVDQFIWPMNLAVILFYESKPEDYERQLEESLAKTLVQFYPLAGRYMKNDHIVDCSDHGAEFVEAEALDAELIDLVAKGNELDQLNALLPETYYRIDEAAENPLLSIQATRFPCGGAAIAVCVSHRVFDVSSLGTFIAAWSDTSNLDKKVEFNNIVPTFNNISSLLPYLDLDLGPGSDEFRMEVDKISIKRLLFDKEAITSLRSKIRVDNNGKTTSRVRVVCAVIAKAMIGVDRAKHGQYRDFTTFQAINMRERTIPPQAKHVCGNFSLPSQPRRIAAAAAEEIGIQELVDLMGDTVGKSISEYAEILSPESDGRRFIMNTVGNIRNEIPTPETSALAFTDWSKFGFYEANFGWEKPVWTSVGPIPMAISTVILMSDKEGDGIEAWLYFNENDMRYFEQDEEIKMFTT